MNDINNLKTQLSEISHAARNKADAMVRKRDQELDKLRNHHGRRVRNLHLQQEMEVRNLHSDRMMSQYMKQTCLMQLRIEHMNQQDNLKAIYHKEMDRIVEHHREKFDEESENFQHRREQISCLIEQLKSKGDQPGAIDEQFGPHVNTSLIKAPCRANNNTKSLVTVCLPANIATSILREDEVYNSFYNYE
ncbi:hypothetical protein FSP39_023304 [Pinctada imbricata]|uniref:Uncharacterized protein n=1 Tax=Pinctada imbricata TaxID=66713 RepID=A0AA88YGF7_PINIB|nr:hypothetical protein FSP39_023304 [Pinctada imbricata]